MRMVELSDCYQKDASIVSRQIAGEMILVPIRRNVGDLESIYTLNDTAALAWSLFDGKTSLAQICERITQEYDVSPGQVRIPQALDIQIHQTFVPMPGQQGGNGEKSQRGES